MRLPLGIMPLGPGLTAGPAVAALWAEAFSFTNAPHNTTNTITL
jgi:hypothetical protein